MPDAARLFTDKFPIGGRNIVITSMQVIVTSGTTNLLIAAEKEEIGSVYSKNTVSVQFLSFRDHALDFVNDGNFMTRIEEQLLMEVELGSYTGVYTGSLK